MKWRYYPLKQVAPSKASGLVFRTEEQVWNLTLDQIESHTGNILQKKYSSVSNKSNSTYVFDQTNVLYSKLRPYLNKVVCPDEPGFATTELIPLQPIPEVLDRKYLAFFLKSRFFLSFASKIVTGSKMPRVIMQKFWEHEIPLPSFSEQRRIVEIIEQAERLLKMRTEADKKAEHILPGLFVKMFGDPTTNPKGCPVVPISEMVVAPERTNPGQYPDKPFKYIDIAGVNGHTGVITEVKSLVGGEAPSRARQVVVENDVIVSTVRPYLRATAIVPKEYNNQICSTGFCVLRARAGIGFGFLYALTRLQWFTDQLNSRARGASYPAVSDQDILSLRVPVPNDENIMKKFDLCLLDILSLNDKKATSFKKISCLFDIILCRAFSGDLTASWRQAHMKELLQEMEIQAKVLAS